MNAAPGPATAATLGLSSNPQSTSNTLSTPTATQIQQMQTQTQAQTQTEPQTQAAAAAGQPHQIPDAHNNTDPTAQSHPTYPHQVTGHGGPTATAPFLQDFNLVAEAAKRAQVAIVTRDLEGVSL